MDLEMLTQIVDFLNRYIHVDDVEVEDGEIASIYASLKTGTGEVKSMPPNFDALVNDMTSIINYLLPAECRLLYNEHTNQFTIEVGQCDDD